MLRLVLAGVAGGVAMFVWSSIAHMILPLGNIGIQEIPNDESVTSAMDTALGAKPGLYMFPSVGLSADATEANKSEAMALYDQKLATRSSGLLLYHPPGAEGLTGGRLVAEFITELFEALIIAFVLATTALATFAAGLGLVAALAAAAAVTTNVPYWNWYGFPTDYTLAYMSVEFVAYLVAGLAAMFIVKPLAKA